MEILLLTVAFILLIIAIFLFWRAARQPSPAIDINQAFVNVQQEINSLRNQLNTNLGTVATITSGILHTQSATGERLSELSQSAQRMIEIGKDIATLHDILKPPKLRGVLGETMLSNLLSIYLPGDSFKMQYQFSNGVVVDAVIWLPAGIVPVDAKFPLDNFRKMLDTDEEEAEKQHYRKDFIRDVRKHVDDIAKKYILPDEGTLDFALSYIPAENVYYEIIIKDTAEESIVDYALSKRVIPVSPNTFYAHLQSIAIGLKGLRVEKYAKEILADLTRLKLDFNGLQEDYRILGTHIHNAGQKYGDAEKKLTRFGDRLLSLEVPAKDNQLLEGIELPHLPQLDSKQELKDGNSNEL